MSYIRLTVPALFLAVLASVACHTQASNSDPDYELAHHVHKSLHYVSNLKSFLMHRGVQFQGDSSPLATGVRQRRQAIETGARRYRKRRFSATQKEHAMNVMKELDDSVTSSDRLRRKQEVLRSLNYNTASVLSFLPAKGSPTREGACRLNFSWHELAGKPQDVLRHARIHLLCRGDACTDQEDSLQVTLSNRMKRKCLDVKATANGDHMTADDVTRATVATRFSATWKTVDVSASVADIHPCNIAKADLYLSGPAMDSFDCTSAVVILTTRQLDPLASPQGNMSVLTDTEVDTVANAAESHLNEQRRRRRRSYRLSIAACQLHRCNISFLRMNWIFVVSPKFLDVGACHGDCLPLTQYHFDGIKPPVVTNNVVIRHWYRIKLAGSPEQDKVSPVHCVPVQYSSATIGYALNEDVSNFNPHTIKMEELTQLRATRCGCR